MEKAHCPKAQHPSSRERASGMFHLTVGRSRSRAGDLYCGVLGFRGDATPEVQARVHFGRRAINHHIGLNTWESKGGPSPAAGNDGTVSYGNSLSEPPGTGPTRCNRVMGRAGICSRRRQRSRRQRSALPAAIRRRTVVELVLGPVPRSNGTRKHGRIAWRCSPPPARSRGSVAASGRL